MPPSLRPVLCALALGLAGLLAAHAATAQDLAVIAHPGVGASRISLDDLRRYYTMDATRWPDGGRVQLYDLRSGAVRDRFYAVLGRQPQDLKRAWMRLVLSGEAHSPTAVADAEAMLRGVAATPGAIGFVPAHLVDTRVRVLLRLPAR